MLRECISSSTQARQRPERQKKQISAQCSVCDLAHGTASWLMPKKEQRDTKEKKQRSVSRFMTAGPPHPRLYYRSLNIEWGRMDIPRSPRPDATHPHLPALQLFRFSPLGPSPSCSWYQQRGKSYLITPPFSLLSSPRSHHGCSLVHPF